MITTLFLTDNPSKFKTDLLCDSIEQLVDHKQFSYPSMTGEMKNGDPFIVVALYNEASLAKVRGREYKELIVHGNVPNEWVDQCKPLVR